MKLFSALEVGLMLAEALAAQYADKGWTACRISPATSQKTRPK
jgi:hypothetical protein